MLVPIHYGVSICGRYATANPKKMQVTRPNYYNLCKGNATT